MNILNAQVNPALAKNIMYLCMAAPAVAFGLRMAKSATEYVDGASGDRALGVSSRAPVVPARVSSTPLRSSRSVPILTRRHDALCSTVGPFPSDPRPRRTSERFEDRAVISRSSILAS